MDPQSLSRNSQQTTRSGQDDGDGGEGVSLSTSDPSSIIKTCCTLPPASGILRPLSSFTSLPSSGYVATSRRKWNTAAGDEEEEGYQNQMHATQVPHPSSLSINWSVPFGSQERLMVLHSETYYPATSSETKADRDRRDSFPESVKDESNQEVVAEPVASPSVLFGLSSPTTIGSNETGSSLQSVQKRSQTMQVLRDEDEEGIRTWRRLIVEYS